MNMPLIDSSIVFKRSARDDSEEFSIERRMLKILMEFDGRKNLGEIAQRTGLSVSILEKVAAQLLKLKLIDTSENCFSTLDRDFIGYLQTQLSLAVGPIAEVLIEDAMADLGQSLATFPSRMAAELIELLARDIQREEKKLIFKQNMIKKIKGNGF